MYKSYVWLLYISIKKILQKKGNYEEALVYLTYLKPYYPNDEKIEELEDEYKEKISVYILRLMIF